MDERDAHRSQASSAALGSRGDAPPDPIRAYRKPTAVEISLACEISAYAPDQDDAPLF